MARWADEELRIASNVGDGTKGRYFHTKERSGNLEVRLPPRFEDWQESNFDVEDGIEFGFKLQPGLEPHVGDRIHFYGVDSGELYVKATAMVPDDYPWMSVDDFAAYPYAGLDILSSQIEPDKLAEIWPQIQTEPKRINVVKKQTS